MSTDEILDLLGPFNTRISDFLIHGCPKNGCPKSFVDYVMPDLDMDFVAYNKKIRAQWASYHPGPNDSSQGLFNEHPELKTTSLTCWETVNFGALEAVILSEPFY